jgi:hypothetical protein
MNWSRKLATDFQKEADIVEEAIIEKSSARTMPPKSAGIKLSGTPGETVTTSFRLNSGNPLAQQGTFVPSYFISGIDHTPTKLRPKFEPTAFDLSSGEPLVVHISIKIFKNAQPGWYKSRVEVEGVENAGFDILLEVKGVE